MLNLSKQGQDAKSFLDRAQVACGMSRIESKRAEGAKACAGNGPVQGHDPEVGRTQPRAGKSENHSQGGHKAGYEKTAAGLLTSGLRILLTHQLR